MTDIYRTELDIPEKSKIVGWIIVSIGIAMILIAIGVSIHTSRELAKTKQRPWIQAQNGNISQKQLSAKNTSNQNRALRKGKIARAFLLWVLLALGLLIAFALIAALSHRLANKIRFATSKKITKTTYSDAWAESGRQFKLPENNDKNNI